jgi:hypothetical protein
VGHYWRLADVEQEQQEMAVVVADWLVVVVVDDDSTLANAADQFAPLAGPRSEMENTKFAISCGN